jgi:hypothetical protein
MEAFAASMAFCEAPFEGTSALPVRARSSASASSDCQKRGGDAVTAASSVATFAANMAFCEVPFEGTVALPVRARDSASASNREKRGGDAVRASSSSMAPVKDAAKTSRPQPKQEQHQRRRTVDGLPIFETMAL